MTLVPDPKLLLTQRINGAMQDVAYIQREHKVVPGAGFRPISAQAVKAKVRPILIKWGIVIAPSECLKSETIQWTSDKGKPMFFTTVVQGYRIASADNPADSFTCSICACGADQSDKGANKALTMTEKQLFINLFHIEVGDDAESSFEDETPTPEQVATISESQVVELLQYAQTLKLDRKIIASAAGVSDVSEISLAKFPELKERLLKRIAQTTPVQNGVAA
ncbi:MAG: hypothetical protein E6Q97_07770 [Desulfurellales bacterium]|nr:MAG: hypothetical protein E6Q97_07770 [Desulfurellales bacterium]